MAFDDDGRASTRRGAWLLVHIPSDEARSRLIDHGVKLLCDVLEKGYDEVRTAVNATFFKKRKEPLGKAVVSSGTLRVWSADGSEKLGANSRYICVDYDRPTASVDQQLKAARPPSPRYDAEDVQSLVKKWEYTSFKSLPREERWELLTDLQRRSKELREEWKTKIKTMNSQALKRKVDSQDDDITSAKNKALKFQKYDQTVPITSISALETLTASYRGKGQDKKYAEQLRAQLQVRQHCYEWKKSTLPKFGDKHNDQELTRLEKELRAVVVKDLGEKEAPPLAYALRPAHPAMAADAIQLQVEQLKLVSRATFDVMRLAKSGPAQESRWQKEGGEAEEEASSQEGAESN